MNEWVCDRWKKLERRGLCREVQYVATIIILVIYKYKDKYNKSYFSLGNPQPLSGKGMGSINDFLACSNHV